MNPFWVEADRWDISSLEMFGKFSYVTFKVDKEATVQHLLKAIKERGNQIYIGFSYYTEMNDRECDIVKMAQFGQNICHSSVWFGEHVTTLKLSKKLTMSESPLNYGIWELVKLPFLNVPLAFRIGVDILLRCNEQWIGYEPQTFKVLWHVMSRLFGGDTNTKKDYDPDKPETWLNGVHCSQLTLLFLKRCILHNALYIPSIHKDMFMKVYSYTCLPFDLRVLLKQVWGNIGEFRNYGIKKKTQGWYVYSSTLEDTKPLN
jgi:hypothetical protein